MKLSPVPQLELLLNVKNLQPRYLKVQYQGFLHYYCILMICNVVSDELCLQIILKTLNQRKPQILKLMELLKRRQNCLPPWIEFTRLVDNCEAICSASKLPSEVFLMGEALNY